jgi:ABC-type branched-subunit amino acid transport system ATPase component
VLQGVSLTVGVSEVVAILGRNGVGKTTLIRSIIGFTFPRRGVVRFKGQDVTRWPSFRVNGLGNHNVITSMLPLRPAIRGSVGRRVPTGA